MTRLCFYLINVYLPYYCKYSSEEFSLYLGKIAAIIQEAETPMVCTLGDINADFKSESEIW